MINQIQSGKIMKHHLDRKAIVYLRQSTDKQLRKNKESQRLQYALKDRAKDLKLKHIEDCFLIKDSDYYQFSGNLENRRSISEFINKHPGVRNRHESAGNVFLMRRTLIHSIENLLKYHNILFSSQVRGAFADYVEELKADFTSIAAGGWGPELVTDEEILHSQFPEVLEEIEAERDKASAQLHEFLVELGYES